jgi:hypothetical protein
MRARKPRPRGTCGVCGDEWTVRLDGLLSRHGRPTWCPGSLKLPTEGVLMDCMWCSSIYLSEDDGHRFCSESCAAAWEREDGTWEGWDIDGWREERAARSLFNESTDDPDLRVSRSTPNARSDKP